MTREIPYIQAIMEAITEEMQRDPNVIFYGQEQAVSDEDPMVVAFGRKRVRPTPISETAEIGMAVGAAMVGLRPVVELLMTDFILVALDQVVNEAARVYFKTAGRVKVPIVLKAGYGFAAGWSVQHANCWYNLFMGVPGLKVVVPSTPADAKGLMKAAIRDDNPVVYLHNYMLTLVPGPVPDGDVEVPIGVADVKRSGRDVTVIATGWMVQRSLEAADLLAQEGIDVEVVDPRSLAPLDLDTLVASVEKTRRVVLVDQAPRHASASALIAAEIAERAFGALTTPPRLVTALDTSVPYSKPLEDAVIPSVERIVQAIREVVQA
ncbi:alpha-ketoacid dehydrogenase subunit beta [Thermomicrobium sp. CFH 73360]|uniref:alpha-ketoacid dehydrogenase subunit beta n=1 Tax=Thermomicrobium sp. CFH 73360 TaxID=2951987 RepID=UPI00207745DA|nr:transketolase C-terminal domain-containing protein [Thermomicrobium sp. CFH 73360]MCM8746914.1 alpha-ketoacid dehydrogenase subunit beta [Thermomicrobium sp. CFH 73360]